MAGKVDQVAGGGEDTFGALRDFETGLGQRDLACPPLDQFGADLALQFAHLHGQRRLSDRAVLRRPAEMPMAGERGQIAKLTQGDQA